MSNDQRDESEFGDFDLPGEGTQPEELAEEPEEDAAEATAEPRDLRGGGCQP